MKFCDELATPRAHVWSKEGERKCLNCEAPFFEPVVLNAPDGNGKDEGATKPSNPKDVIGSRKVDPGLVPDTMVFCAAVAFTEGATKYGRFNWRVAGVRSSIYHAALKRHLAKWWNGQNYDPNTSVHHLDNALACLAILRDAELYGKLTDDRPPSPNRDAMADLIDGMEPVVAHLKELFRDHAPYQFTIADTPNGE